MLRKINKRVNNESTIFIYLYPRDENDDFVIVKEMKWSLFDRWNNIVNDRENIEVSDREEPVIVLSGDDLKIDSYEEKRYLLVECKYDSKEGSDLTIKEYFEITVWKPYYASYY